MKKRVVLDSSVIISGSLTSGPAGKILDQFKKKRFAVFVSLQILQEVKSAFIKPSITKYYKFDERQIERLTAELLEKSVLIIPKEDVNICRDPFDNHVLSLAKAAKAHFLISYDQDLLILKNIGTTKILSPKEFLILAR